MNPNVAPGAGKGEKYFQGVMPMGNLTNAPKLIPADNIDPAKTKSSKGFIWTKEGWAYERGKYELMPDGSYQLKDLPKAKTEGIPTMKRLQDMRDEIAKEPEADDLIQDLLPDSSSAYMLIAGRSGIGKTFLLLNILYCLASGTPFMSRKTKKCKVGYLSLEGDRKKILKRFNTIGLSFPGAEDNIFWEHHMPFKLNSKGIDWLTAKVDGLDIIGIDPLRPLVPGDYTIPKDVSAFIENLRAVQDKTGVAVIGSHHIRKPDKRIKVQPEDLLFEIKGASEYVESATSVLLLERGKQERGEFGKFVTNTSLKNLHFVKIKDAPAEPIPLPLRFNAETYLFEPIDKLFGDEGVNGETF